MIYQNKRLIYQNKRLIYYFVISSSCTKKLYKIMAETKSIITQGNQLFNIARGVGEQLLDDTVSRITEILVERAKQASTLGYMQVDVSLRDLKIDKQDVQKGTALHAKLEEWSKHQQLKLIVLWHHGGCSYCENCDSDCYPKGIRLNWNRAQS